MANPFLPTQQNAHALLQKIIDLSIEKETGPEGRGLFVKNYSEISELFKAFQYNGC